MSNESVTLEAALARLAAAIAQIETAARAPLLPPAPAAEPAPAAAGRADGMMDALRADLAARYFGATATPGAMLNDLHASLPAAPSLPLPDLTPVGVGFGAQPPGAPQVAPKDEYSVDELMGGPDEAFVRNAFVALLRREPDPAGYDHYRASLGGGQLSRRDVLCVLRNSAEGRKANVRVHGLRRVGALRRVSRLPVLGRLVMMVLGAWRLPALARRMDRLEAASANNTWEVSRLAAAAEETVRLVEFRRLQGLSTVSQAIVGLQAAGQEMAGFAAGLLDRVRELQEAARAQRNWAGVFGEALYTMDQAVRTFSRQVAGGATRAEILRALQPVNDALAATVGMAARVEAQRGEMAFLEAAVKQTLVQANQARPPQEPPELPELDTFYRDFENRFRGTRDDIMSRVEVYVDDVAPVAAATRAGVLDIGSGRGEWLELLKSRGIEARGLDSNAAMVRDAQARGLRVDEGDALAWMRLLPPASLGAVTAFHVVEHLEFPVLVALLDQVFRVLKPGGMLIFETPNPENLLVGAFTFWYDPTHQRPLPPEMLRFVAEARGFQRVDIRRLHPSPEWDRLPVGEHAAALRERLDALLYGPRDYALIAYKP